MNILGLILARGGSKGIPRKNVVPLAGKPLISWTIEAALQSKSFSRLIVSTDNEEIAEVSRNYGAEVPFMRPAELSQDNSSGYDATIHALDWMKENGGEPDYVFILQPTSPLRTADDIRGAIDLGLSQKAEAVIGVTEASPHPYLARTMSSEGVLGYLIEVNPKPTSRHDYPQAWSINGAVYLTTVESLRRTRTFQPPGTLGFVMPVERSIDIDSPWELHLTELILRNQGHGS